ncbi:MAG: LapA family protein [Nocardioidaceae bacterium]
MTETPRPQGPEPDEPSTGSTEFTPGKTGAGASRPSAASSSGSGTSASSGAAGTDTGGAASGGSPASTSERAPSPAPPSTRSQPSRAAGDDPLARTRVSGIWVGIIVFTIILILLLVFVVQNTAKVEIKYFVFKGHISLAVAMLLSAVAGVLLTAIAGSLRILQLRRRLKQANTG